MWSNDNKEVANLHNIEQGQDENSEVNNRISGENTKDVPKGWKGQMWRGQQFSTVSTETSTQLRLDGGSIEVFHTCTLINNQYISSGHIILSIFNIDIFISLKLCIYWK